MKSLSDSIKSVITVILVLVMGIAGAMRLLEIQIVGVDGIANTAKKMKIHLSILKTFPLQEARSSTTAETLLSEIPPARISFFIRHFFRRIMPRATARFLKYTSSLRNTDMRSK